MHVLIAAGLSHNIWESNLAVSIDHEQKSEPQLTQNIPHTPTLWGSYGFFIVRIFEKKMIAF